MRADEVQRPTPEQAVVQMGAAVAAELAQLEDRELAARIMRQVVDAWDHGIAEGRRRREAGEVKPERERPGTMRTEVGGPIRALGPDDVRARGWDR